ncbi:MAG: DUF3794 domain-containing protein, partial [Clostridiales bacterium]|nr:DUF3794 domain-containing protein [Clostridiales bacterium]
VDDDSVIEFVEHEIPFNGTIEMLESKEGMIGDATLKIKDVTTKIKPDTDGEDRIIEVEARVFASVKVYGQSEAEILSDAYLINKSVSLSKATVSYPQLIFRNKSQCHVKETVNFQDAPEILQILTVSGTVTVDDITILTDKINANGIINADILYIAKNDDVPIYNYKTIIPFEHIIEAKGISPESGAEVEIEPSIDYSGFNMLGSDEAEIRFIVGLNAKAIKRAEEEIVTDVVVSDMTPEALAKFPSITIYSVQRGDSLWKVAKRFNTSIDELIAINEIENPDKIYPGQKLVILKNIA